MEKICVNHPTLRALSLCHGCGDYYCSDCLNEGKEFYYCNKPECYQKYLIDKPLIDIKKKSSISIFITITYIINAILFFYKAYSIKGPYIEPTPADSLIGGISYSLLLLVGAFLFGVIIWLPFALFFKKEKSKSLLKKFVLISILSIGCMFMIIQLTLIYF